MTRQTDEQSLKQEVDNSWRVFTVVTVLFFFMKTALLYMQAKNTPQNNDIITNTHIISKLAFAALFFLFSLFTNISITKNKLICGKEHYSIAGWATAIPFIFIYIIGLFALWAFAGWTDCFSETWGRYILDFCGIKKEDLGSVIARKSIGEGIWNYLLGWITLLVSFNYILAENCNAFSIKKDEFKKYLNDKYTMKSGKKK